jgi:hypothetical protein
MPVEQVTTLEVAKIFVTPLEYTKINVKGIYPFKVRFKDIGYPGFSQNTTPRIGIAIIGSTFYIL